MYLFISRFGFEGGIWFLIAPVPVHCFSITSFLHKINKIDNKLCSFCHKETESIFHLLCTCDIVKEFWDNFKTRVIEKIDAVVNISDKNKIYSSFSKSPLINFLIILTKYYIYKKKNKFHNKRINIRGFEAYAQVKFKNEMSIAKINNTYDKFLGKWSSICHYFMN